MSEANEQGGYQNPENFGVCRLGQPRPLEGLWFFLSEVGRHEGFEQSVAWVERFDRGLDRIPGCPEGKSIQRWKWGYQLAAVFCNPACKMAERKWGETGQKSVRNDVF